MSSASSGSTKTSVHVRSASGSFSFTGTSGDHTAHKALLDDLPSHPLKTHLLERQKSWDEKYGPDTGGSAAPHTWAKPQSSATSPGHATSAHGSSLSTAFSPSSTAAARKTAAKPALGTGSQSF